MLTRPAVLAVFVLALAGSLRPLPASGHPGFFPENPSLRDRRPPGRLEVKLVGESSREVAPGTVVTTAFQVINHADEALDAVSRVEVPEGWTLVSPVVGGVLQPGASVMRLVVIHVPARAHAKAHNVKVSFRSQQTAGSDTLSTSGVSTVEMRVQPKYELDVQLGDLPALTRPGATHTSYALIANKSNIPVTADLHGTGGNGLTVHLDSARLHLPAQTVRRVGIEIEVAGEEAENVLKATTGVVEVTASPQRAPKASEQATRSLDVVPVALVDRTEWKPLASAVTLRMAGRGRQGAPQVEIAGGGKPFEGSGHSVKYLARIPYQRLPLSTNFRETYRLRYQTERFDLRLGDHAYGISPLSTPLRRGRGGALTANLGDWTMGGSYRQGRRFWRDEKAVTAFLRRDLGTSAKASTYYVRRLGSREGQLGGVRGQLSLPNHTQLSTELSISAREGQLDGAYRFALAGGKPKFTYNLLFQNTDPGFVGNRNYEGTDARSVHLAYRPIDGLRLEGDWSESSYKLAEEDNGAANRFYQHGTRGVGLRMDGRWKRGKGHTFVGYERQSRTVGQAGRLLERTSDQLSLRAALHGKHLGLNATAEFGRTGASDLDGRRGFQRYYVRANTSFPEMDLAASAEYQTGARVYSLLPDDRWTTSVDAQVKLSPRSQLIAGASAYLYDAPEERSWIRADRVALQGRFKHTFSSGHVIQLRGRYHSNGFGLLRGRPSYTVSYSIPFGVPIKQKTPRAQVQGRVLREGDGQPVPDVLVHLEGMSVWTDQEGRFAFRAVSEGPHQLVLDPSSLEMGWTIQQPMPMRLNVDPQRTTRVNIQASQGGSLKGQVMLYEWSEAFRSAMQASGKKTEADPEVVSSGGLGGIALEATNGTDKRRLLSDEKGRFSTAGLYPGQWTLRVHPKGIPEHHYVEQKVFSVKVEAGHQSDVQVKVLPRERTVRIIESGKLE